VLDSEQLLKLEPALAPDLPGGVHFPDTAQVRNPRHLRALIAACQKLNVRLLPHHAVQHVEHHGGRVTGIVTPVGRLAAHRYLVAAGSWSDEILRMVGLRSGIRPVRGQIVLLQTPSPLFTHILLAGSEYLVPRDDGRVLAGSTEEEVGYDKRTTADAVLHLLALATRLVPALAAAQVERCWAGLRPGNPDGKPFLGSVPGFDNLILAAGHFRTGIHLSPITGLLMKELLLGQPPSLPLDAFRLDRLQH
jgi:glycine oxidase